MILYNNLRKLLSKLRRSRTPAFLVVLLSVAPALRLEAQSTLSIVNAGVEDSEDGPLAGSQFQFLPGEYVYVSFQIAGFTIKADEERNTRNISLRYDVTPVDEHGVPLAQPMHSEITTGLNPEDKNWVPKRRWSFLLPSYVGTGTYQVRISVADLLGKTETVKTIPFQIGGLVIKPLTSIGFENFRFTREEGGIESLEVPAFRPGDPVYCDFDLTGYQLAPHNLYHVSYSVTVNGPDGKPFLKEGASADLQDTSFYPPQFLPGSFTIDTSKKSLPGQYVVVVTAHDLIGKHDVSTTQIFSLE